MQNNVSISKFLSLVLRHNPKLIQLDMNENGWVSIEQLIENAKKLKNIELSIEKIRDVVETNDKKRFSIDSEGKKIRANQGHSIKVDLELKSQTPPDILYHGTATRFIDSIKIDGLKPMLRQHIHLSTTFETALNVGKRHGKPIILEIKSKEMHEKGYKFYLSENKVWLVDRVPKEFINIKSYGD
ncbi:MAG: RNA 2'-phosphotransferase [Desulfobacterales bacterium]|nr:RNA 2'-phosphotransferase [Desulfobacterales bacterium]